MTEFATQDDHVWLYTDDPVIREVAWRLAVQMGATYVRFVVYESYVAKLGWSFVQRAVAEANGHGLRAQVVLTGPPRWDPVGGRLTYADPKPARFAEWVREAAAALPSVSRWSLWNEPNLPQFLHGGAMTHAAALYAHLWEHGYQALRAERPNDRILFGELSGGAHAARFLANIARGFEADGLALHPYQFTRAPRVASSLAESLSFGNLPRLRHLLADFARHGHLHRPGGSRAPLPIYATEFGYPAHGWPHAEPEKVRAQWAVQAWRLAKHWRLEQLLYYHLTVAPAGTAWNTGIAAVTPEGGRYMTPTYMRLAKAVRG